MRILIYGLNYAPELTGIGKYTGEMASWLSARGHDVHVVAAPPYYPAWRIREDYRGTLYRTERVQGQPVVYRTPLYVPDVPSGVKRMAHLFSFMVGSLPVMLREMFWQPEVVFTVEPTFFGAPLALLVAAGAGASSWLHVQDFEVDAAFDLGLLPAKGPVHALALWLEKSFTSAFSCVSSISVKMVERTRLKGVPAERAVLFPNWVDVEAIHPQKAEGNNFRAELGLEGKILLLYSGNMGNKQGLELLAPLARFFEDDARVHFLFCGDGAFRPQLEALVGHHPNVTLLPLQPLERLNELLNAADIHLLPQRAGAADLVMPSKLTGMLSSGRPVIATADAGTQVAHVVEGCGLVVPAEDEDALHAAVSKLIEDEPLRLRLGEAARRYAVEHLGKEEVLLQLERDLEALVSDCIK
ncbi:WcaI family glycosyltransferase [Granulicella arctica]|uniref:Colanic acid biosynthesis glycosyl transferase WcaI n=1 Tax=Granulicella arctica TaxID=940613 RepID=A0A7Y9PJA7_9BACT|nr:colanic acid biosynthesis glycosyl transferase WcaI [Granulicella arctica]